MEKKHASPGDIIGSIDIAYPIKALIVTIAIVVLSTHSIPLIQGGYIGSISGTLSSLRLLINSIVIFVILYLYDYITAKKSFLYQEVIGSILAAIILTFGGQAQVISLTAYVFTFILLYIGFLIGVRFKEIVSGANQTQMIEGVAIFLLVIWVGYIAVTVISAYEAAHPATTTTSLVTTTVAKPAPTPFYTVMGYKGNYLVFLTCQGSLCSLPALNATLQGQSSLIPYSGNGTIEPILSQQQRMEDIFGFGLNGSSTLNASELASGSLKQVFHTPVQLLTFNLTLSNIKAYGGSVAWYYNPTYTNSTTTLSLNETILATQQASVIFINQAHATPNIGVIGVTGALQYFINSTIT